MYPFNCFVYYITGNTNGSRIESRKERLVVMRVGCHDGVVARLLSAAILYEWNQRCGPQVSQLPTSNREVWNRLVKCFTFFSMIQPTLYEIGWDSHVKILNISQSFINKSVFFHLKMYLTRLIKQLMSFEKA